MTENQMSLNLWPQIPSAAAAPYFQASAAAVEAGQGKMAKYLLDFKSGLEPQTTQWIRLASLVASHSFSCDIVVRALGPKEKTAGGATPLDKLGAAIARKTNAKYFPGRLQRVEAGTESLMEDLERPGSTAEVYKFDKSFLSPTARVLVVGDVDTTPATFEAIASAIHQALPRAEVKVFTLAWVGEHLKDDQINGKYFTTSVSPLSVLKEEGPAMTAPEPKTETLPSPPRAAAAEPDAVPQPESPAQETVEVAEVHQPPTPASVAPPVQTRKPHPAPFPFKVRTKTGSATVAILLTGMGIVLITSAIMLFAKKPSTLEAATFRPLPVMEEPVVVPAKALPTPPAPPAEVAVKKPQGPQAVVTVPSAGLRSGHSLDSKPVRGTVRNNERVTILKRHYADAGPGWVQIETKSGKVGWVWAAVVREIKGEKVTTQ